MRAYRYIVIQKTELTASKRQRGTHSVWAIGDGISRVRGTETALLEDVLSDCKHAGMKLVSSHNALDTLCPNASDKVILPVSPKPPDDPMGNKTLAANNVTPCQGQGKRH